MKDPQIMSNAAKFFIAICIFSMMLFKIFLDLLPETMWFWIFSAFYGGFGFIAVYLARGIKRLDVFSPLLPAIALSYLYAASSALSTEATGMTIYQDVITSSVLKTYYIACFLGELGLGFGFILAAGRPLKPVGPLYSPDDRAFKGLILWFAPILALVCFPWVREYFDFINVQPYNETALAGRLAKQAMGETQPLQEVFLGQGPSILLMVFALLLLIRAENILFKILGFLILISNISTSILGGQRLALAMAGTAILVFYHYRVKLLGLKALTGVFVGGFLMTSTLSFVRSTNDFGQMAALVLEGLRSGGSGSAGAFLAFQNSTEFAVGQNLMRLIAGIHDGQSSFTYGYSILTEITVFIPRVVFPARPLPLPDQFVVVFYPGVHETGAGYGFFNLMEGYWAFGLPGVALFMTVYGIILFQIYKIFVLGRMTDFKAAWYGYVIFSIVFTAGRSGIIGVMKTALISSIPFLVFLMFFRLAVYWKSNVKPPA